MNKDFYRDFDFNKTRNSLLAVIDMQEDFITGALGTEQARAMLPYAAEFVAKWQGDRVVTKDTHDINYLNTQEGRHLPVIHAVRNTPGWQLVPQIRDAINNDDHHVFILEKNSFGTLDIAKIIQGRRYEAVYVLGVCTGICDISNAVIIKAADPEVPIYILADLCACVSPETHDIALKAMKLLQMEIIQSDDYARLIP